MNLETVNEEIAKITNDNRWKFRDTGYSWKLYFDNRDIFYYIGPDICGSVHEIAEYHKDGTFNIFIKLNESGNTAESLSYKYIPEIKKILNIN